MTTLPEIKTQADYKLLDGATANEALAIVVSLLTNEQKNTVISDDLGGRVTVMEFVEHAVYNKRLNQEFYG